MWTVQQSLIVHQTHPVLVRAVLQKNFSNGFFHKMCANNKNTRETYYRVLMVLNDHSLAIHFIVVSTLKFLHDRQPF